LQFAIVVFAPPKLRSQRNSAEASSPAISRAPYLPSFTVAYLASRRHHSLPLSAPASTMSESKRKRDPTDLTLVEHHAEMMSACSSGDEHTILSLLQNATTSDPSGLTRRMLATQQDPTTGQSPLMVASIGGHVNIIKTLLEEGGEWRCYT
jgi:hypothetical protein